MWGIHASFAIVLCKASKRDLTWLNCPFKSNLWRLWIFFIDLKHWIESITFTSLWRYLNTIWALKGCLAWQNLQYCFTFLSIYEEMCGIWRDLSNVMESQSPFHSFINLISLHKCCASAYACMCTQTLVFLILLVYCIAKPGIVSIQL